MNNFKVICKELHSFLILWSTQSFSLLGSSMTSFALILWTYQSKGSALTTALLSVCSYAPYAVSYTHLASPKAMAITRRCSSMKPRR